MDCLSIVHQLTVVFHPWERSKGRNRFVSVEHDDLQRKYDLRHREDVRADRSHGTKRKERGHVGDERVSECIRISSP